MCFQENTFKAKAKIQRFNCSTLPTLFNTFALESFQVESSDLELPAAHSSVLGYAKQQTWLNTKRDIRESLKIVDSSG